MLLKSRADISTDILDYMKRVKEAAAAYDSAAILYHGEFARTNQMLGAIG
ncbi:MAG TPA: hypothetical protein PKC96_07290 [Bacilli bacterium]|nr:hypothetical protein [Bacilli bacterium]